MDTTPNLSHLAPSDRTLLDRILRADFDLESLISASPDSHPAQSSLLDLLAWLEQPLIKSITDFLVAAAARAEAIAQARLRSRRIISLEKLFHAALALIPSTDDLPQLQTQDPKAADKLIAHTFRAIREARLVAHNLEKALNPAQPKSNPTSKSNRQPDEDVEHASTGQHAAHHTAPQSDHDLPVTTPNHAHTNYTPSTLRGTSFPDRPPSRPDRTSAAA